MNVDDGILRARDTRACAAGELGKINS